MVNKTNTAFRIKNIIKKAYDNKSKSSLDVWKNVFSINEKDVYTTKISILFCLNNLKEEFEIFKNEMLTTSFSQDLYEKEINQLQNLLIDPSSSLNGDWQPRQKQITEVQFKILDFCSEILPKDEIIINDEDISKLTKLITDLEEFINSNELPKDINKLIKKHLLKIKNALYSYEIKGVEVFDEVLESAYGEIIKNPTIFKNHSKLLNKLSDTWTFAQEVYKKVNKTHNTYIDLNNIMTTVQALVSN